MLNIQLENARGELLAAAAGMDEARLFIPRAYEPGDRLRISGGQHVWAQLDQALPGGEIYLPEGTMEWRVPEGEDRAAYAPGAFEAGRHVIQARIMTEAEQSVCRDVARNPADLRGDTDFYPHCTANVETRNEACFCARNVIDGLSFNSGHGEWPFESWGIGAREDAWCRLDFGRTVRVERMALTLRADFPHDAYWISGFVVGSDGRESSFDLQKTAQRQLIDLGGREVRWLRLERLIKSDDPSAFPSLRTWEVFGRDVKE